MTATRIQTAAAFVLALSLWGCTATTGGTATQQDPAQADDATDQASKPAIARPIVKPSSNAGPRIDPGMRSTSSTLLSRPNPVRTNQQRPPTPAEWQPEWFVSGSASDNGTPIAGAVATNPDLLEARRQAVSAAFDLVQNASIDLTVTRQLDDGTYRVWVRARSTDG